MPSPPCQSRQRPLKVGMTLDIADGKLDEYKQHHDRIWPAVRTALAAQGLTNVSLWVWPPGGRLFYYAEYVGEQPFDQAMQRYASMERIQEWEELMHTYQKQLVVEGEEGGGGSSSGSSSVWWRPMDCVYSSDF